MKELIKAIAGFIAIIGLIVLCGMWDFKVWRLEHPTTPTWVYIFRQR